MSGCPDGYTGLACDQSELSVSDEDALPDLCTLFVIMEHHSVQFSSKHFIRRTWGIYMTLIPAREEHETRMDNKLRQGYKHAV